MHTQPFSDNLLQHEHPYLLSCKPQRPGCHQWRPLQQQVHTKIKELKPDVIVERYLDAKYYHYDPADIYELSDYNVNAEHLAESDKVVNLELH